MNTQRFAAFLQNAEMGGMQYPERCSGLVCVAPLGQYESRPSPVHTVADPDTTTEARPRPAIQTLSSKSVSLSLSKSPHPTHDFKIHHSTPPTFQPSEIERTSNIELPTSNVEQRITPQLIRLFNVRSSAFKVGRSYFKICKILPMLHAPCPMLHAFFPPHKERSGGIPAPELTPQGGRNAPSPFLRFHLVTFPLSYLFPTKNEAPSTAVRSAASPLRNFVN